MALHWSVQFWELTWLITKNKVRFDSHRSNHFCFWYNGIMYSKHYNWFLHRPVIKKTTNELPEEEKTTPEVVKNRKPRGKGKKNKKDSKNSKKQG